MVAYMFPSDITTTISGLNIYSFQERLPFYGAMNDIFGIKKVTTSDKTKVNLVLILLRTNLSRQFSGQIIQILFSASSSNGNFSGFTVVKFQGQRKYLVAVEKPKKDEKKKESENSENSYKVALFIMVAACLLLLAIICVLARQLRRKKEPSAWSKTQVIVRGHDDALKVRASSLPNPYTKEKPPYTKEKPPYAKEKPPYTKEKPPYTKEKPSLFPTDSNLSTQYEDTKEIPEPKHEYLKPSRATRQNAVKRFTTPTASQQPDEVSGYEVIQNGCDIRPRYSSIYANEYEINENYE